MSKISKLELIDRLRTFTFGKYITKLKNCARLNSVVEPKTVAISQEEINDLIIDSIQDIKGKHILKLDLRRLHDSPTDFFIICEGDSTTQVRAITDNIRRRLREEIQMAPLHVEGERAAAWICMDYFNTVVHIFHKETRKYYELEDLWSDARLTEYETL